MLGSLFPAEAIYITRLATILQCTPKQYGSRSYLWHRISRPKESF